MVGSIVTQRQIGCGRGSWAFYNRIERQQEGTKSHLACIELLKPPTTPSTNILPYYGGHFNSNLISLSENFQSVLIIPWRAIDQLRKTSSGIRSPLLLCWETLSKVSPPNYFKLLLYCLQSLTDLLEVENKSLLLNIPCISNKVPKDSRVEWTWKLPTKVPWHLPKCRNKQQFYLAMMAMGNHNDHDTIILKVQ